MAIVTYNKLGIMQALRKYAETHNVASIESYTDPDRTTPATIRLKETKEMVELVVDMLDVAPTPVVLTDQMVTNYLRDKLATARDEARRYQAALDGITDELPF